MMNKQEFNQLADGGSSDADAARIARAKRAGARVIEYANIEKEYADDPEAGNELKAKMEDQMDAINRNPASFETIIEFGVEPIKTLGGIAKQILEVQTHMAEQVKVMNINMDKVTKSVAETGLDGLLSALKGLGQVGAAGAKGVGNLLKKFGDAVGRSKKKRTEEEKHVQDMIDKLPEMYFEMLALSKGLKDSEDGIKSVMKEAEKLGMARVAMVREINVYLGAAPEVLRRYDEVYIKEARDAFTQSQDPEDEVYLTNIIKGKENFQDQYRILEGSRAQGIDAAQQLRQLMDEMEKQRKIIIQFRTIRENEWIALMSGAGLQASALKVAQMIKQADDTGDKLHGLTVDMMEKAHEMTLNSQGRGTVDTGKLIESLQRRKAMIEKENQVREQRAIEAENARKQLRAETDKLLDSVESSLNRRILEAAPEKPAQE
ncbi:MAG: hypothetical protein HY052_00475, partial [Proteobacteria bacterium]|nr:hypothetical protein [Pseudomonadota bacterium]